MIYLSVLVLKMSYTVFSKERKIMLFNLASSLSVELVQLWGTQTWQVGYGRGYRYVYNVFIINRPTYKMKSDQELRIKCKI